MVVCQRSSFSKQRRLHDSGEKGDKCSIILEWATQVTTSSVHTEGLPLSEEQEWFLHSKSWEEDIGTEKRGEVSFVEGIHESALVIVSVFPVIT